MPRNRRIGEEIVKSPPTVGTYKPTDTITLDIADGRVVVRERPGPDLPEKPIPQADMADLSDVQELRVRLIREGFYGEHQKHQLARIERWLATERVPLDEFDAEAQRRFGPWPKARRDAKGRVLWSRHEANALGPGVRGLVLTGDRAVIAKSWEAADACAP